MRDVAKETREGCLLSVKPKKVTKTDENQEAKKQTRGVERNGTKMTCSSSARAHCKASGCICLKKRKKKRGRDGRGGRGVFIDEGMGCLRLRETERVGG